MQQKTRHASASGFEASGRLEVSGFPAGYPRFDYRLYLVFEFALAPDSERYVTDFHGFEFTAAKHLEKNPIDNRSPCSTRFVGFAPHSISSCFSAERGS